MKGSRFLVAAADLLVRGVALGLLVVGLFAFSRWVGYAVANPGDWLEVDLALYRVTNGIAARPLVALWVATINEPAPGYLALIVLLLGYCAWRKRALLPVAALAVAVVLGVGLLATGEVHRALGHRPRPFLGVPEAVTPITGCTGPALVALRDADGPTASCDDSQAEVRGVDWREIWVQFATFPSGHLRETASLGLLLAAFWRASWPYVLAYTLIMAFSRVHLGAHYPSDVLVGALIGLWSAAIALFALDALGRLLSYLRRLPVVGGLWSWVAVTRVPGRPYLDPLPARLIRVGAYFAGLNLALYALGYAATSPDVGQLYTVLASADIVVFSMLTAQFNPPLAPMLFYLLGPAGVLYSALAGATVLLAALRRRPPVLVAVAALVVAVLVAFELRWLGEQVLPRVPPVGHMPEAPVPTGWRERWVVINSFPSLHALLTGALGGVLAGVWGPVAIPAQLLGLAGAAAAVYFGAAWTTDALAGYLMGNMAALLAWYAVRQFWVPRRGDAGPKPEGARERIARHVDAARRI